MRNKLSTLGIIACSIYR